MIGIGSLLAVLGVATAPARAQNSDHAKLWQAYCSHFISADGRVIDPQGEDRTTSEGQSYALFFALVNDDRARFDKVFEWTQSNLAAGDIATHLPAWTWGRAKDGEWGILDPNSASDSDLWIAYDLVEAGRLWKDPHYFSLGRKLATLISHREVANLPGFGPALLPAAVNFKFPKAWVLNPSYTPVFLLDRLAKADPASQFADVAAEIPTLLERSARNGFAMDWVSYTPGSGFTPSLANNHTGPQATGSYDAIRVYLWAGMLADSSPAKARILNALPGMNTYLQNHTAPPEKISNQGIPLGQDGPVGFSAALLPYLQSLSSQPALAQQLVRFKSQLDEKSNLYGAGYGSGPAYYDQNLALFATGWMEKRFQFGSSGELLVRWTRE
ncbi:cellulose synthase complex periplasmic endoglucanase BcsZ [Acidicapsa ligni]|uniref:cellulose synthase complex periplasmic endoglucanase BcsZ n=1 Tax=Acidicapsa ligni TaxID=542300 RepID=UPI0021DF94F3|nr:cellulose synthase complex periplasmic endoglucanase BcsZ [Acidicapsa ligni]